MMFPGGRGSLQKTTRAYLGPSSRAWYVRCALAIRSKSVDLAASAPATVNRAWVAIPRPGRSSCQEDSVLQAQQRAEGHGQQLRRTAPPLAGRPRKHCSSRLIELMGSWIAGLIEAAKKAIRGD